MEILFGFGGFIIGLVVGAGAMFFIYRNNVKGFADGEKVLKDKLRG